MRENGFVARNRKSFLCSGFLIAFISMFLMRYAISLNFVPLKSASTVRDVASDMENSFLNPWVTSFSIVGWVGIFIVAIALVGMYFAGEFTQGEQK